jgi:hypothetical protein
MKDSQAALGNLKQFNLGISFLFYTVVPPLLVAAVRIYW